MNPTIEALATSYGWTNTSWQKLMLRAADVVAGTPDGRTSVAELDRFLVERQKPINKALLASLPSPFEQQLAVLRSEIARAAGDSDHLLTSASCAGGQSLERDFMRICYDADKRIPA